MATTRFYDILFLNRENSQEKAFHIENAKNKAIAINACHKAILQEYQEKVHSAVNIDNAPHVSYEFDGVRVTSIPTNSALLECGNQWVVKKCKITTIAGSYTKKRNADGSKKRKRDNAPKETNPKGNDSKDTTPNEITLPNGTKVKAA